MSRRTQYASRPRVDVQSPAQSNQSRYFAAPLFLALCFVLFSTTRVPAQSAPTLYLTQPAPGLAQISWSTNFPGWQLMSSVDVTSPANWQVVSSPTNQVGGSNVVYFAITNRAAFFQLRRAGFSYNFQANPSAITAGGSSTLSWATNPATTFEIFPPGVFVAGTNYIVSPTNTTIYTLVASNTTGVVSNTVTVTVSTPGCVFEHGSGWDCALHFDYAINAHSASDNFVINESADLTFHFALTALNGNIAIYKAVLGGTATVNDSETQGSNPMPITVIGSGTPEAGQSGNLTINCGTGTYTFDIQPVILASWTGSTMDTRVGSVYVNNRALPATFGPLTSSGTLPAHGPLWSGGGDFYFPGGLGSAMFLDGAVTDTTAGNANVSWTFTPSP